MLQTGLQSCLLVLMVNRIASVMRRRPFLAGPVAIAPARAPALPPRRAGWDCSQLMHVRLAPCASPLLPKMLVNDGAGNKLEL